MPLLTTHAAYCRCNAVHLHDIFNRHASWSEECCAACAAADRHGSTMRLDPTSAEQPPPQAVASLNLARVLTAAGGYQEALTLYGYAT